MPRIRRRRGPTAEGSGVMSGGAAADLYVLRDLFTTTESAPIASPRTCEPGPGTFTINDTGNKLSIASAILTMGANETTGAGNPRLVSGDSAARAAGLCQYYRIKRRSDSLATGNSSAHGISIAAAPTSVGQIEGFYFGAGIINHQNGQKVGTFSEDTFYDFYSIIRSSGHFVIMNTKLLWVNNAITDTPLYACPGMAVTAARRGFECDDVHMVYIGSPWNNDYGIATQRVAIPSTGELVTSEADALLEFTWNPVAAETLTLMFRRTDDDNTMKLECDQAAGTIKLFERSGGVDTELAAGKTQTWTAGTEYRIVIVFDGTTVRTYVANVLKHDTTSSYNNSATGCKASGFATGEDFIAWPRTIGGEALTAITDGPFFHSPQ